MTCIEGTQSHPVFRPELEQIKEERTFWLQSICCGIRVEVLAGGASSLAVVCTTRGLKGSGEMFSLCALDICTTLEEEGLLDPVYEVDLFALHFVFIPSINQQLESFKSAYYCAKYTTKPEPRSRAYTATL